MVAFLQKLPELSEQEYTALVSPNEASSNEQAGEGHAQDDGHDHDHGDMSGMMGSPESGTAEESADSKSASPAQDEAESGDHYADGHTH